MALIDDVLLAARIARPYYGRALAALTPVPAPGLGTVGVDPHWRLYYDEQWLASLSPLHAANVIAAHEVEHLLRKHNARSTAIGAEHQQANLAGDLEINDDVAPDELPPTVFRPAQFKLPDGLTMEEYLTQLPPLKKVHCQCGSGSGGEKLPCELGAPTSSAPGLTDVEGEVLIKGVANDVKEHASRHPGTVPDHIVMWANEIAKPVKIDWRRHLSATINRALTPQRGRDDYSWRRLGKQRGAALRPGLVKADLRIDVVADTSGSMAQDGAVVLGTLATIKRLGAKVTVWSCDTDAHKTTKTFLGGGGTDLRVGLARCTAPLIVVITDCETPWPDSSPAARVVVVATTSSPSPSWATRIEVLP